MLTEWKVHRLPILVDNYVFIIIHSKSNECLVIDPGEFLDVDTYLTQNQLILKAILITHHHADHIGGAEDLQKKWNAPVFAPLKNKSQIHFATNYLTENDILSFFNNSLNFEIFELPGHTLGHVAYYEKNNHWLFSGDVLFGLGCGRLFEGTFEQSFYSLQRLKKLPARTLIYCSHEYTEINLEFCKTLTLNKTELFEYEKNLFKLRQKKIPSVPLLLENELKTNPFLLVQNLDEFTKLRQLRNQFKKND